MALKIKTNFADVVAQNPLKSFSLAILILLIIVFLVSKNVPLKIGSIQIGKTEYYIHDTIFKIKYDTIYLQHSNEKMNAKKDAIKVQSYNQKGGQTANEITNK